MEQAIARLGYVRNRAPRAVRSQQAGSIALVVGEESVKVFADPFFARILLSFGRELAEVDLQLVLLTLHTPRDYHMVARYLRSGHVDGAFFVSMHLGPGFDLAGLGIPVVLCGRPLSGGDGVSYVDADNIGGAKKAVNYLLGSGRTAVATIAGPPDMAPGIDRLTVMTGAVLLILLIADGITPSCASIDRLLTLHFFLGMLIVGPVALKAASDAGCPRTWPFLASMTCRYRSSPSLGSPRSGSQSTPWPPRWSGRCWRWWTIPAVARRGWCSKPNSCSAIPPDPSNFHDFALCFKCLTWPEVRVPGTLWLSDLLSP